MFQEFMLTPGLELHERILSTANDKQGMSGTLKY